ncbi:MAG: MarR family transcriptional regulator [Acidimicrobiia bacterium]|nr:MarR family transcriptional regulator [Acidimicrobiia bacterium]
MGVFGRISRASRLMERQIEAIFSSHNLQGGRFDVLAALRRAGPPHVLSPTNLYNSLLITSGAMTHRLDHLERAGLIERIPHPNDGRGSLVKLTPAGAEALDAALEEHLENEHRLIAALEPDDREALAALLHNLLVALGDTGEPAPADEASQEGQSGSNP